MTESFSSALECQVDISRILGRYLPTSPTTDNFDASFLFIDINAYYIWAYGKHNICVLRAF